MTTKLQSVAAEPLALATVKAHLRVEHADEDALITALITAARELAEQACRRSFATCTWQLRLDAFPAEIRLDWAPAVSITSVAYIDTAGDSQTLAASAYVLDTHNEPAWLLPAYGTEWPDTLATANAVTVTYVAGDATTCPESVRQWMLLHIANWYHNREASTDKPRTELPFTERLLDRWRVY